MLCVATFGCTVTVQVAAAEACSGRVMCCSSASASGSASASAAGIVAAVGAAREVCSVHHDACSCPSRRRIGAT